MYTTDGDRVDDNDCKKYHENLGLNLDLVGQVVLRWLPEQEFE